VRFLRKNCRLSHDNVFRISARNWKVRPLDTPRFATCVNQINGNQF